MGEEYPRAMYAKDGGYRTVSSPDEERDLGAEWSRDPSPEHFQPVSPRISSDDSKAPLTKGDIPAIVEAVVAALMRATPPVSKKGLSNG
jgi:hypothetical protein